MQISCTLLKDHWVFPSNPNVADLNLIMIFIPNFVWNTPLMPTRFHRSRSGQLVLRFPFCQLRPLLLQLLSPLLKIPATAPANRTNDFWLSFFLFLTWDQILVRWSQRTMFVFSLFWQEIVDGVKRERERVGPFINSQYCVCFTSSRSINLTSIQLRLHIVPSFHLSKYMEHNFHVIPQISLNWTKYILSRGSPPGPSSG